ncbi:MAG TPA: UbiH/UbiF family hydroxylase [Xanthobacteraceae bacterium]|nr:UbiH/UbiF family hydroxylase [Xanthobacteraceae bacterium]
MGARQNFSAEVAVVGGGPAGLVSAIALKAAGVDTLLIAIPPKDDHRTTALLAGSVTALATLGAWQACVAHAAPLKEIRIIDDTRRLIRAPEVAFSAAEIGLDAFGCNIENRHLLAALYAYAAQLKLPRIDAAASAIASDAAGVTIKLADGEARVQLAVGADGRRSLCRVAADIAADRRSYPQTALTLNLAHARPHRDASTEFHTESGPFTLVPLPGRRSSLVCVLDPARAAELYAKPDAELSAEIERRAHSLLGALRVEPGRGIFPLAVQTARCFARERIALVGEAAHVVPPIGAQGLNLGLRDAATLAEFVADARRQGLDLGSPDLLARYDARRRVDVMSRRIAVDVLNRSLLTDFIPAQGARGLLLHLVDRVGPLRRALMREGVMPSASQPRLMRGEMV